MLAYIPAPWILWVLEEYEYEGHVPHIGFFEEGSETNHA